ncbi:hypothetical protein PG989_003647 [Apiospora arundinis]
MSFGYSVGDFVTGYNITYQLVRILADSRGASIEYQEARTELRAMEQVFLQAGSLVSSKVLSRDIINGIACIVLSAVDIIDSFYERSKEYQHQLGERQAKMGKATTGFESSWCKIGWALFKKEELRALKAQLHERLTSVNVLIGMASWQDDQSKYSESTLAASGCHVHASSRPLSSVDETSQTQQRESGQPAPPTLDASCFIQRGVSSTTIGGYSVADAKRTDGSVGGL